MWVMLLWALTLPGHEVIVYDFLLNVVTGKHAAALAHAREEISRSEEQGKTSHVFLDAAPASYAAKFHPQPLSFAARELPSFSAQPIAYLPYSGYTYWYTCVQKLLLVAVCPNAP